FEPEPEPEPEPFVAAAPTVYPEPVPQEVFEEPIPEPEFETEPKFEPEPEPEPEPFVAAAPTVYPEPVPQEVFEEPIPEPEFESEPKFEPEPEPESFVAAAPTVETETVSVAPIKETPEPPDLAEAELLLRALENQPRDLPPSPATEMPAPVSTEPAAHQAGDVEDLPVREPMTRHGARRSRRSRSRVRRRRVRLAVMSVAIVAAAAIITGGYVWIRPALSSPEARFASAERMASGGSFSQASAAFESFASAYPQHPLRSSAEFMAAHFASMSPAGDFDEEQAVAQRALGLFENFLRDNPTHVKAPRAWVMLAQLHYKLGRYQEAVKILRDPVLRLRDPESGLPGLRTLARSYVRLGELESAVSAYQQAAAFAGNYAPDADYDELGDLFKLRADRADDPGGVQKLRLTAVENWKYAIRVQGIDPANKAKIQDKIKWLESQFGEQQQPPATPGTEAVAASPTEPAPTAPPAAGPIPPAPAVDPAAEARFLGGGPVTDPVQ
ncbi:MAG: tetratricopeptide repeat protein, partial [Candidatus Hydrogenedentes bacterium]|nr:tetratricopeptide repeat protein [Candidatus Hydrogenedentota bacterium]